MVRVWTLVVVGVVWASNATEPPRKFDMGYDDDVSLEYTAAALVETLAGSTRKSFWILQSTKKINRVGPPPGLCVFGSRDGGIDGWYKLVHTTVGKWQFHHESSRESKVVLQAQDRGGKWNWFLADFGDTNDRADDVVLYVVRPEENSGLSPLPPITRNKWRWASEEMWLRAITHEVPFILPADDGSSCRMVGKPGFSQNFDALIREASGRSIGPILVLCLLALLIAVRLFLWIGRLRRNLAPEVQQQLAVEWHRIFEEDRHDNLGAQPPLVNREAEAEEEEEDGDDEQDDVQQPLSLADVRNALGRAMRWIFQAIKTLIGQYLLTADVTKPLLVLVLTMLWMLTMVPSFISSTEKILQKAKLEEWHLDEGVSPFFAPCLLVCVVAMIDMYRRSTVLLFKVACAIGLGNLRDAEVQLLRKKSIKEFATCAAVCFVSVFELTMTHEDRHADLRLILLAVAECIHVCTVFSCLNLLAWVARSRLAHFASTPHENKFWERAWQHVRLYSMLLSMQVFFYKFSLFLVVNVKGILGVLKAIALAVQVSKQGTQAFAHHTAFAYFELGPSLREMKSRLQIFVFGGRRRRRRHRPTDGNFFVTTYYVELAADIIELSLDIVWCAIEFLMETTFHGTGSSVFFNFAVNAQSRLRARITSHRAWREARSALINANDIFTPATQEDIDQNDDVCVICMDEFRLDEGDNSRIPLRLPCNHILHRGCLQQYINTAYMRENQLQCMICQAPLVEQPAPAAG